MSESALLCMCYAVGAFIRLWLMNSDYNHIIADRVEVSTPLNSWKRVTEGVFLHKNGISPYDGDLFHETPLGLTIYSLILQLKPVLLDIIFVTTDMLTGFSLQLLASNFVAQAVSKERRNKRRYAADSQNILLTESQVQLVPLYVACAYNCNPYSILSCVGRTTTVFNNLCLATAFLSMSKGWMLTCCLGLAFATYQTFYPVMFIVPACMYLVQVNYQGKDQNYWPYVILTVFTFGAMLSGLLGFSYHMTGSWTFLDATYKFILLVPDLRPNVGLFWYFFTEMFEHFRPLFVCAFQINCFLYVAPLALRLRKEPMLLAYSLTALSTVFRSYPSLGDLGFYLGLLPIWIHLLQYMQQGFVVCCFFLLSSVLGPVVWQLWIYSRSANANFYFGVTLAFATAQIFLITDILFAYIKREFSLIHGTKRELEGKPAKLVLE